MVDHRRQWPITDDLAALRENIQRYAVQAGLTGPRLDDLVIAANEAAINVLEHGGGAGTLAISCDGGVLAVDVADHVGVLRPGAVPSERPSGRGDRGFGLWLMGELCDSVTIDRVPGQSTIRLSMQVDDGAADGDAASLGRSAHPV
ncbi:ATP-binding protein [Microbispora catharanthi]|uniref:ATP-binding protein n=1 Tax=Microbispora catharanthi TaxID=1712871 RepID=A0A5N6BUP2_9ACTN|nr:ATP-binding protein [Microbispora catharanthi]KAB8184178.1 ATP-binding protein [Microbispora catharanthi]